MEVVGVAEGVAVAGRPAFRGSPRIGESGVGASRSDQVDNIGEAVRATASDVEEEIRDMRADEAMTRRALKLIASGRNDAYEVAMAALREDTQDWWADVPARDPDELDEGEEPATADAGGLPG